MMRVSFDVPVFQKTGDQALVFSMWGGMPEGTATAEGTAVVVLPKG
jgi:hypothetical protein